MLLGSAMGEEGSVRRVREVKSRSKGSGEEVKGSKQNDSQSCAVETMRTKKEIYCGEEGRGASE